MGQYYIVIIKRKDDIKEYSPSDYDNGYKLMEHSYQNNEFVNVVVNELIYSPARLAWVGDYADPEDYKGTKSEELAVEFIELRRVYDKYTEDGCIINCGPIYFINHTKKEYFELSKTKIKPDEDGVKIHPLPLLTAMGNGYGGGDYFGSCQELVGSWATDLIEVKYVLEEVNNYHNISDKIAFEEKY